MINFKKLISRIRPSMLEDPAPATEDPAPTPDDPAAPGYFTLSVKMDGYQPFLRRLRFPTQFTLRQLHQAIQAVTLFEDYHPHSFVDANGQLYAPELYEDLEMGGAPDCSHLEQETLVGTVLRKSGDTIQYEYDFGDGWEFSIEVENWEPMNEGETPRITCLGGEKAGPIEDCGGVDGFLHILKTLAGSDKKAKEKIAWMCESYKPDRFDLDKANRALARITEPHPATPRKKRATKK